MDKERFDPEKLGERSRRAYWALADSDFWDGQWHPWPDLVALMLSKSDLTPKSCCDILRGMEHKGELVRQGKFSPRRDRRMVILVDNSSDPRGDGYDDQEWADEMARRKAISQLRQKMSQGCPVPSKQWEQVATVHAWSEHQKFSS